MPNDVANQITLLLADWNNGDTNARDELLPLVYEELRQMARRNMRREAPNHSFQTTDLIHEAYLKLAQFNEQKWENRSHFFGVAAKAMRHILVDYARSKQSEKRGGGRQRVSLADEMAARPGQSLQLLALEDALKTLESLDGRIEVLRRTDERTNVRGIKNIAGNRQTRLAVCPQLATARTCGCRLNRKYFQADVPISLRISLSQIGPQIRKDSNSGFFR